MSIAPAPTGNSVSANPRARSYPFSAMLTSSADAQRRTDWMETFGTEVVPIESPTAVKAISPHHPKGALFYRVNVKLLSIEQFERVTRHLASKFRISEDDVAEGLRNGEGLPILAEDVMVSVDARFVL